MSEDVLKVSIIVPIYNSEQYLRKCIESIGNQEYSCLEIILIDDGSEDSSYDICKEYAQKDERILLIHQSNHGLVYSRGIGIQKATGKYITFVDSDDYIDTNMISVLVSHIVGALPDIIAFDIEEEYEDDKVVKRNKYDAGYYDKNRLKKDIYPSMLSYGTFFDFGILPNLVCKLIKRDFLNRCTLSVAEDVTVGEDVDLTLQLLLQAESLEIVQIAPYHYCKRADSMMWRTMNSETIDLLENDLYKASRCLNADEFLLKQIKEYMLFVKLLKNPKSIAEVHRVFSENNRVALYGAGGFGQALYGQYKDSITVWADRNDLYYSQKGYPVISIRELVENQNKYDLVYIAILNVRLCEEIRKDLWKHGVKVIKFYDAFKR